MPKKETPKYDGWLVSDSFFKRALAVYGHNLVGGLIIFIIILFVALVSAALFFLIAGGIFGMNFNF